MQKLKDKVILITGANRGIGKSLVKAALGKGAAKVYATSRNISKIPDFDDDRVVPLALDITNSKQIAEILERTRDVQILINNAGSLRPGTILEGEKSRMEEDMQTNYHGTVDMMRQFASVLEKNAPSKIVNIVSIVAYSPFPSIAGYSASKAALFSASLSVRTELSKRGVMIQIVNPGAIDTDMNKGSDWDMPKPDNVAKIIMDRVETDELEIIPDTRGLTMFSAWRQEPSNLAAIFDKIYHG
ncbi:SDR family NAD(P)-dependent oxidoreductase [Flavobacterium limi]|uniref:Short-chain dehydrogenase n=1 Tax=Flavobacterium limi TaxID=2045105 RepID=A0ABQ1UY56_9FLAO|nr:SDR family NAD(P)-dependent oxidoreductase [Flavobacterium limi]GGF28262.1 short-chain dehydrogenase [Flavobacterium limi]